MNAMVSELEKRISILDSFIESECMGDMYTEELEENDALKIQYYTGLMIAAAIQEQTAAINGLKDLLEDVIDYKKDAWGNRYGAVSITGGLNTYEQN